MMKRSLSEEFCIRIDTDELAQHMRQRGVGICHKRSARTSPGWSHSRQ
jgi:hypothetical protein